MPRAQGSLAAGTFAAYSPATQEMELCDVSPGEQEEMEGLEMEEEEGQGQAAAGGEG